MGKNRSRKEEKKLRCRITVGVASLCVAGAVAAGAAIGTAYTTCYTVEYQGSPIAYVDNKDAIQRAVLQAESLTSDLLQTDYTFGQDLEVRAAIMPRDSVAPLTAATDSLMEQIPELSRVYTLTVDGVYIGAADKAETITQALELVKDRYRTSATVSVTIESQLDLDYAFRPAGAATMDADQLAQAMLRPVTRTFPYTTQTGDTMGSIARRFSMDPQRLEDLNAHLELEIEATDADIAALDEIVGSIDLSDVPPDTQEPVEKDLEPTPPAQGEEAATDDLDPADIDEVDPEALAAEAVREAYAAVDAASGVTEDGEDLVLTEAPLCPGQEITVEQTCSLLVVDTVEEQVADREVQPEKLTLLDSSIPVGTQEVLVEGSPGTETVMTRITKRCGVPVSNQDLNSISRLRAEPLLVAVGYGSHPELYDFFGAGDMLFQWPVQGRISSDYGYRHIFGSLNFHRGVDIPAPMGTAVHAAADGTVIFAGAKGSYGNLVIIDHGNGFQTLYGHNSGFLCRAGDVVVRGQTIAAVGSTGRSTGPHCHFEVHLNGELVDPLMYLPGDNNAPARIHVSPAALNPEGESTELPVDGDTKPAQTQPAAETPAKEEAPAQSQTEEPTQLEEFRGQFLPEQKPTADDQPAQPEATAPEPEGAEEG